MPVTIDVEKTELWNEETQEFHVFPEAHIVMEHSLISISKWESKWHKPWVDKDGGATRSKEEWMSYFECMTITPNVNPIIFNCFSSENIKKVISYIEDPMTATIFSTNGSKTNSHVRKKVITSEEIYGKMIEYGIPFSCEKWPLNRLLVLIRICSIKETNKSPGSKMGQKEILKQNAELNALRRASTKSRG